MPATQFGALEAEGATTRAMKPRPEKAALRASRI
jgi:hypothetical protein